MSELFLLWKDKKFNHQLLETVLCFCVSPWVRQDKLLMAYIAICLRLPGGAEHCQNVYK